MVDGVVVNRCGLRLDVPRLLASVLPSHQAASRPQLVNLHLQRVIRLKMANGGDIICSLHLGAKHEGSFSLNDGWFLY